MLEALLVILIICWVLGITVAHAGGIIHLLLVIALIVFIIRLIGGRPAI